MPLYEIADRHKIRVDAPAEVVLSAAREMDLERSAIIRAIFKGREWIVRSKSDDRIRGRGFVEGMKALGWGMLAELPGREIVMGGVTQPWEPNPVFRALPPDEFVPSMTPATSRSSGHCVPIRPMVASPFFERKHVQSQRIQNRVRSSAAIGHFFQLESSRFVTPSCRS
jgi:hypothetical protein